MDAPATTASVWTAVLRVWLGSSVWEFPFTPYLDIEGANFWERSTALLRRVEDLCGRPLAAETALPPKPDAVHIG